MGKVTLESRTSGCIKVKSYFKTNFMNWRKSRRGCLSAKLNNPSLVLCSRAGSRRTVKRSWNVNTGDKMKISCESRYMQFVIKLDSINLALLRLCTSHKKWEILQLGESHLDLLLLLFFLHAFITLANQNIKRFIKRNWLRVLSARLADGFSCRPATKQT